MCSWHDVFFRLCTLLWMLLIDALYTPITTLVHTVQTAVKMLLSCLCQYFVLSRIRQDCVCE